MIYVGAEFASLRALVEAWSPLLLYLAEQPANQCMPKQFDHRCNTQTIQGDTWCEPVLHIAYLKSHSSALTSRPKHPSRMNLHHLAPIAKVACLVVSSFCLLNVIAIEVLTSSHLDLTHSQANASPAMKGKFGKLLQLLLLLFLAVWDTALVPRRLGFGGLVLGCGCGGCGGCARAEVDIKGELPLQRGRQDEDFAKGMAFGLLDEISCVVSCCFLKVGHPPEIIIICMFW